MTEPLSDPYPLAPADSEFDATRQATEHVASPVARLNSLLRGRYAWAIGLGIVLGVAGAAAGAYVPGLTYTSRGMIEVAANVPRVLYRTDENGMLPMYESYVSVQVALLRSRQVGERAFASQEWKDVSPGRTDEDKIRFLRGITVEAPRGSQYIEVSFSHAEPKAAMTAVEQVIKAFMGFVQEREGRSEMSMRSVLENKRTVLAAKLQDVHTEILAKSGDMGAEAIEATYQSAVARLNQLTTVLHEIDVELAGGSTEEGAAKDEKDLTPQEIAVTDTAMDRLLYDRAQVQTRIENLEAFAGTGNEKLMSAQRELSAIDRRIEERRQAVIDSLESMPNRSALTRHGKEVRRAQISSMRDEHEAEVRRLGKIRGEIARLTDERRDLVEQQDEVKRRLEQISVESEVDGRITVLSSGDLPLEPDKDRRRVLAALGGVGGMVLGFAAVALYGALGARMRHLDDLDPRSRRGRFLGIVPDVHRAGGEAVQMADFCVHHVRAMLQLRSPEARRIIAVTSASPAAGKSTVAMALGLSFSGAGASTLLVDCDLVGRGLSSLQRSFVAGSLRRALEASRAGTEPRAEPESAMAGLVEARSAQVSRQDLATLVSEARGRVQDCGSRLAAWTRAAELLLGHESGESGRREAPGILDAMSGRPLEECVRETGARGLSLLSTGRAEEEDVGRLSMEAMTRLLDECSMRYDVVIVDTGPVISSLEASFALARAADVLLVVPRGESQSLMGDALSRLEAIGARVSGLVFNRASVEDVMRSSYSSRSAQASVEPAAA